MVFDTVRAALKHGIGAERLTRRQLKRMFDAADGSGNNGRNDRKLTKAELVLAMRRDDGSLAALFGLPSPVVSSMDEHREFNRVFEALDCQRGSRSMITFDEFHEYTDSQYSQRTAEGQARLAMAAAALLVLLLLAYGWRRAAKQRRVHDKST